MKTDKELADDADRAERDERLARMGADFVLLKEQLQQKDAEILESRDKLERLNASLKDSCQCLLDMTKTKDQRIAELELTLKHCNEDWADDDTRCKELAKPFIGDFDGPEPRAERGIGFRGVVEVTEALTKKLSALEKQNAELRGILENSGHNYYVSALDCACCRYETWKKENGV